MKKVFSSLINLIAFLGTWPFLTEWVIWYKSAANKFFEKKKTFLFYLFLKGQFIEVQVTDGALYRTKIHCYFLDQTRVIRPLPSEKNYHIFYQMLAGLSREERVKLNLEGYSPTNLRYLQGGDIQQDEKEDMARFQAWKNCLSILGIPFLDVVRVLAAVLLLGNVQFIDGQVNISVCKKKNK